MLFCKPSKLQEKHNQKEPSKMAAAAHAPTKPRNLVKSAPSKITALFRPRGSNKGSFPSNKNNNKYSKLVNDDNAAHGSMIQPAVTWTLSQDDEGIDNIGATSSSSHKRDEASEASEASSQANSKDDSIIFPLNKKARKGMNNNAQDIFRRTQNGGDGQGSTADENLDHGTYDGDGDISDFSGGDDDDESFDSMEVTTNQKEDFKQREIAHMRFELANREHAITKLVEINKDMEQKHHTEIESLTCIFNQRLKDKEELIRVLETQHSKELQVMLEVKNFAKQNDSKKQSVLQTKLDEANTQINLANNKHEEELCIYDKVLMGLQEDLFKVQSQLEITTIHLAKTSSMLLQQRQASSQSLDNDVISNLQQQSLLLLEQAQSNLLPHLQQTTSMLVQQAQQSVSSLPPFFSSNNKKRRRQTYDGSSSILAPLLDRSNNNEKMD